MKTNSIFLKFEMYSGSGYIYRRADKIIGVDDIPKEEIGTNEELCNIYIGGGAEDYMTIKGNAKDIVNRINLKLKEMF